MSMVGSTYLWEGEPVTVVIQWRTGHGKGGPRNVAVRRADGSLVCVPSYPMVLRKVQPEDDPTEEWAVVFP